MLGRRVGCGLTRLALIGIGQLHAAAGNLLHLFGQPPLRQRRRACQRSGLLAQHIEIVLQIENPSAGGCSSARTAPCTCLYAITEPCPRAAWLLPSFRAAAGSSSGWYAPARSAGHRPCGSWSQTVRSLNSVSAGSGLLAEFACRPEVLHIFSTLFSTLNCEKCWAFVAEPLPCNDRGRHLNDAARFTRDMSWTKMEKEGAARSLRSAPSIYWNIGPHSRDEESVWTESQQSTAPFGVVKPLDRAKYNNTCYI
jgi:hypothetical protein